MGCLDNRSAVSQSCLQLPTHTRTRVRTHTHLSDKHTVQGRTNLLVRGTACDRCGTSRAAKITKLSSQRGTDLRYDADSRVSQSTNCSLSTGITEKTNGESEDRR